MKRNTLQELFRDHYEEIQYTLHPRKTEMDDEDLLDMDYFMHEDDEFFDEVD